MRVVPGREEGGEGKKTEPERVDREAGTRGLGRSLSRSLLFLKVLFGWVLL